MVERIPTRPTQQTPVLVPRHISHYLLADSVYRTVSVLMFGCGNRNPSGTPGRFFGILKPKTRGCGSEAHVSLAHNPLTFQPLLLPYPTHARGLPAASSRLADENEPHQPDVAMSVAHTALEVLGVVGDPWVAGSVEHQRWQQPRVPG
jgi:hypothetical protein